MSCTLKIESVDNLIRALREERTNNIDVTDAHDRFIRSLSNRRKILGLSQAQLAQKTGLAPSTIYKFEKGELKITLCNLIKYMGGIGMDINNIFEHYRI